CVGEEQGGIAMRNKRTAAHAAMAFRLKKLEKGLANLVASPFFAGYRHISLESEIETISRVSQRLRAQPRTPSCRSALGFDASEEIDEVAVRVAEIDRASAPGLGRGRFYPRLNDRLQPPIFLIHIGDVEFQNRTFVFSGLRRARNVLFLCLSVENGQSSG